MEAKVNYVVVGVFVLALGTALIAGVLWLSSGSAFRKTYDTYQVYMRESVSGLSLDAAVRYRGVDVGRVRRIALASQDVEQVLLTLDIERGTPVKQDTIAVLRVQGLTGIANIELTGGHRDSPPLTAQPGETYPVIRTAPSLMVRLDTAVTTLLTNLNRTSENLNALMDEENRRALKQVLADVETLTRTIAARSAAIDRALENTAQVTGELPRLIEQMQRSAQALETMSNEVARAGASAAQMLDSTRGDVRQFTAQTLPDVDSLVAELREMTGTLKRVADELDRNPSVLMFGKPAPKRGPGE
jgi:phospholipid/cholesterol/gamma-HCH transport system substrate-binding protein